MATVIDTILIDMRVRKDSSIKDADRQLAKLQKQAADVRRHLSLLERQQQKNTRTNRQQAKSYQLMDRELIKLRKDIDRAAQAQKRLNSAVGAGKAGRSGLVKEIGLIAAGYVAARKAAVLFAGSVALFANFQATMSEVKARTGAVGVEFERLEGSARNLGATTKFTATQAAEGQVLLAQAGLKTNDILSAQQSNLTLAGSANLDLAESSNILTTSLASFNLEASSSNRVVDVFALTANNANTSVTQLYEGMKFAAPIASGFGRDVEETAASLGVLANNGLKAELGGTGLRAAILGLAEPNKKLIGVLSQLGLTYDDVNPKTNDLSTIFARLERAGFEVGDAVEIAGKRGGPALAKLVENAPQVAQLTQELLNADGAAQRISETMLDNVQGSALQLRSAVEEFQITYAEAFGPELRSAIDAFTERFREGGTTAEDWGRATGKAVTLVADVLLFLIDHGEQVGTVIQAVLAYNLAGWLLALVPAGTSATAVMAGLRATLVGFPAVITAVVVAGKLLNDWIDDWREKSQAAIDDIVGMTARMDQLAQRVSDVISTGDASQIQEVLDQVKAQTEAVRDARIELLQLLELQAERPTQFSEELARQGLTLDEFNARLQDSQTELVGLWATQNKLAAAIEGATIEIEEQADAADRFAESLRALRQGLQGQIEDLIKAKKLSAQYGVEAEHVLDAIQQLSKLPGVASDEQIASVAKLIARMAKLRAELGKQKKDVGLLSLEWRKLWADLRSQYDQAERFGAVAAGLFGFPVIREAQVAWGNFTDELKANIATAERQRQLMIETGASLGAVEIAMDALLSQPNPELISDDQVKDAIRLAEELLRIRDLAQSLVDVRFDPFPDNEVDPYGDEARADELRQYWEQQLLGVADAFIGSILSGGEDIGDVIEAQLLSAARLFLAEIAKASIAGIFSGGGQGGVGGLKSLFGQGGKFGGVGSLFKGEAFGGSSGAGSALGASAAGALGAVLGVAAIAFVAYKIAKDLIGDRSKKFDTNISPSPGQVNFASRGSSLTDSDAFALLRQFDEAMRGVLAAIGGAADALPVMAVKIRNDGEEFQAEVNGFVVGVFGTFDEAMSAALTSAVRQADFGELGANLASALQLTAATSVEELLRDINLAHSIDDVAAGYRASGRELRSTLRDVAIAGDELFRQAQRLGLDMAAAARLIVDDLVAERDRIVGDLTGQSDIAGTYLDLVSQTRAWNDAAREQVERLKAQLEAAEQANTSSDNVRRGFGGIRDSADGLGETMGGLGHGLAKTAEDADGLRAQIARLEAEIEQSNLVVGAQRAGDEVLGALIPILQRWGEGSFAVAKQQELSARVQFAQAVLLLHQLKLVNAEVRIVGPAFIASMEGALRRISGRIDAGDFGTPTTGGGGFNFSRPSVPNFANQQRADRRAEIRQQTLDLQEALSTGGDGLAKFSVLGTSTGAMVDGAKDFRRSLGELAAEMRSLGFSEADVALRGELEHAHELQEFMAGFLDRIRSAGVSDARSAAERLAAELEDALSARTLLGGAPEKLLEDLGIITEAFRLDLQDLADDRAADFRDDAARARGTTDAGLSARSIRDDVAAATADLEAIAAASGGLVDVERDLLDVRLAGELRLQALRDQIVDRFGGAAADRGLSDPQRRIRGIREQVSDAILALEQIGDSEAEIAQVRRDAAAAIHGIRDALLDSIQQWTDQVQGIGDVGRKLIDLRTQFDDVRGGLIDADQALADLDSGGLTKLQDTSVAAGDNLTRVALSMSQMSANAGSLADDMALVDAAQQAATESLVFDWLRGLQQAGAELPGLSEQLIEFQRRMALLNLANIVADPAALAALEGAGLSIDQVAAAINGLYDDQLAALGRTQSSTAALTQTTDQAAAALDSLRDELARFIEDGLVAGLDQTQTALYRLEQQFVDLRDRALAAGLGVEDLTASYEAQRAAVIRAEAQPLRDLVDDIQLNGVRSTGGSTYQQLLARYQQLLGAGPGGYAELAQVASQLRDVGGGFFGSSATGAFGALEDRITTDLSGLPGFDADIDPVADRIDTSNALLGELVRLQGGNPEAIAGALVDAMPQPTTGYDFAGPGIPTGTFAGSGLGPILALTPPREQPRPSAGERAILDGLDRIAARLVPLEAMATIAANTGELVKPARETARKTQLTAQATATLASEAGKARREAPRGRREPLGPSEALF